MEDVVEGKKKRKRKLKYGRFKRVNDLNPFRQLRLYSVALAIQGTSGVYEPNYIQHN